MNGESPSTESRQEFCRSLKAAREAKGITLADISTATKIPASLFAALERGDVRRWPKGLFRRSFFRDYVRTLGLPIAELCDEFVQLFPDETCVAATAPAAPVVEAAPAGNVRLVFDTTWHGPHASLRSRLLVAILDAGFVMPTALALAWFRGLDVAVAVAIVAVTYFSLATVILGETPAHWIKARRRSILDALKSGTRTGAWATGRVGDLFSSVFGQAGTDSGEPVDEPQGRRWMSDAQRVEPALSSRMRVRIKMFQ